MFWPTKKKNRKACTKHARLYSDLQRQKSERRVQSMQDYVLTYKDKNKKSVNLLTKREACRTIFWTTPGFTERFFDSSVSSADDNLISGSAVPTAVVNLSGECPLRVYTKYRFCHVQNTPAAHAHVDLSAFRVRRSPKRIKPPSHKVVRVMRAGQRRTELTVNDSLKQLVTGFYRPVNRIGSTRADLKLDKEGGGVE